MTDPMASQGLWGKRRGAAGLGLWAAVGCIGALGACNGYDLGDILGAIGDSSGHGHGHGHGGHGGVCVLDGERYRPGDTFPSSDGCNTCSCGEDGQIACTLRFCAATCGGITGATCGEGEYCSFAPEAQCGAGDQTGFCEAVPEICTFEFNPVCGCDGDTYGNPCFAAAAGVSIAHFGECGPNGECQTADDCPVPPCACLDEDGDGQCENECPVATCRLGQCGVGDPNALQVGDACGGFVPPGSPECDAGLFCQHQPGALCGAADAPGECVVIPEACREVFDPVCGCDGQTYGNACEATRARAGILDVGECP